jgi:hypothetical protein
MAEIKCPNCGKINPSFADNCLSCQALLPGPGQPETTAQDGEGEIPEWLKRIRERNENGNNNQPAPEEDASSSTPGDLPDWLKELKEEKISKDAPQAAEDEAKDETGWLERLRTSPVYQKDASSTAPQTEGSEEIAAVSPEIWGAEAEENMPDWLKAATSPGEKGDGFVFPKPDPTHPGDITAPVSLNEDKPYPFPGEKDAAADLRVNEGAEYLAAMESSQDPLPFLPGTFEDRPEAGNGKPFDDGFFQTSALTNRIQLSEKQRLNVGLLKDIISNEGEPKPVSPADAGRQKPFGRLAVILAALLLLLGLVISMPIPGALPQLYPVEVAAIFNELSILPQDSPVLIAIDYDPALAGEMQLSSAGMLGHIMARGARIAFISTRPTGAMLADSLTRSVLAGQPQFPSGDHLVNLGYLPGDAAGLRTFARQPRPSTPYTADLKLAWDSPALQGINLLSDFSAVIVITDSAEVMRNWVEQVQPSLGNTPLFVVLSAQAGPLVQPYFESDQIQGGISGLLGGAMYSQILGRIGAADPYLNAFQAGIFLAVLAILGGGLYHWVVSLLARTKAVEEG